MRRAPMSVGFVMNWVPHDHIGLACCYWCSYSESVPAFEAFDQEEEYLNPFWRVWHICSPASSLKGHPISDTPWEIIWDLPCSHALISITLDVLTILPRQNSCWLVSHIISMDLRTKWALEVFSSMSLLLNTFLVVEMMLDTLGQLDHVDLSSCKLLHLQDFNIFCSHFMDAFVKFAKTNTAGFLLIYFLSCLLIFLQNMVEFLNRHFYPFSHDTCMCEVISKRFYF